MCVKGTASELKPRESFLCARLPYHCVHPQTLKSSDPAPDRKQSSLQKKSFPVTKQTWSRAHQQSLRPLQAPVGVMLLAAQPPNLLELQALLLGVLPRYIILTV